MKEQHQSNSLLLWVGFEVLVQSFSLFPFGEEWHTVHAAEAGYCLSSLPVSVC